MVTIFKNIFSKEPFYVSVSSALDRIKNGKSKESIISLRSVVDKERQNQIKKSLPSVCFSGKFSERKDECLIEHSGFVVLDFDDVASVVDKKNELSRLDWIYACWVSPRNNGVKALVRISDGSRHREHFAAIKEILPEIDKSGVNQSRVCYESYDPDLYLNENAKVFNKVKKDVYVPLEKKVLNDDEIFNKIKVWLANKGDSFVSGERNHFIFKLASACCRFGIDQESCVMLSASNYSVGEDGFSFNECRNTVSSAYKSNSQFFGTAHFENETLVDKKTKVEFTVTQEMLDKNIKSKDVVFGEDVKDSVMRFYDQGYEKINGVGIQQIDSLYKPKEGEITLLTGYGNYGKSTYQAWYLLLRALIYDEKFAFFTPESTSDDFYIDFIEILLGCDCSPSSKRRPHRDLFEAAHDWVSKRFFYVYPKDNNPTPEYIKERFLELIIKEGVKGVVIDPFNQMDNNYSFSHGARDKYLESFLGDFSRFSRQNSIYGLITAHPVKPKQLASNGNFSCPTVFDVADGAMWNNKMDNILVYHRPEKETAPNSDLCEIHSKKIRRQKIVGRIGHAEMNYKRSSRRFLINGIDHMQEIIDRTDLPFSRKEVQQTISDFLDFDPSVETEPLPF